jgi:hypothetical protein
MIPQRGLQTIARMIPRITMMPPRLIPANAAPFRPGLGAR